MQKLVWQNANGVELDLTSGNYGITEWEGFSNASLNIQSQQVPFQDGGVFLDALIEQRELSVTLAMQDNNNLELRYQNRRELISALNPKLGEGYLIYTNDFISKRIKCVPQIPLFETHNSDTVGTPKASLSWTACTPYWEDLEDTVVHLFGGQQSNIIKNEGDVQIGAKIDVYASDVDGVVISNLQQNKEIGIDVQYTGNIQINTEFGQKEIQARKETRFIARNYSAGLEDICYSEEKKLFCAVGGGTIGISKNGETWSYINTYSLASTDYFTLYGVCYSEEKHLFVAVGETNAGGGRAVISNNGEDWQEIIINPDYSTGLREVVYSEEKHLFVAVGEIICTSTNGTEWTVRQAGLHPNVLTDICYSKKLGIFVAVGMNDTVSKSSDGTNWSTTTSGSLMQNFSITYSERLELFCKSSYSGTIQTSPDATTWSTVTLPATSNWARVRWCDSVRNFIVIGQLGSITISQDGILWKNTGVSITTANVEQVNLMGICQAENQGVLISVGYDGGIAKSVNGMNWGYIGLNITSSISFRDLAYNTKDKYYLAVGYGGKILKSYDGVNWQYYIYSATRDFLKLIYSEKYNCFVAIVVNSSLTYRYIMTSEDGINWDIKYSTTSYLEDICYSGKLELFCVCGTIVLTSENLVDWNQQTTGQNIHFYSVIFENDKYIMCGEHYIFQSEDGVNWNNLNFSESTESLRIVLYIKELGKYLFIGNTIWTSTDELEEWENPSSINTTSIYNAIYYYPDGMVLMLGSQEYYSYDLIIWNNIDIVGTVYGSKVINEQLCLCGTPASVLFSEAGDKINIIDKIRKDANMTLGLEIGDNNFVLSSINGSVQGRIVYRQKYIGV